MELAMYKEQNEKQGSTRMYAIILCLFLVDLLTENFVVSVFHTLGHLPELVWFFFLMTISIIFAPIQTAASDHFTRKKTIYVALVSNLIAILFGVLFIKSNYSFTWTIPFIIIFKAITGNLVPLGLVTISDMRKKALRPFFLGTTSVYAFTFIIIKYATAGFNLLTFALLLSIFVITIKVVVHYKFFDVEDKYSDLIHYEDLNRTQHSLSWSRKAISLIRKIPKTLLLIVTQAKKDTINLLKDLKDNSIRHALSGYFCWGISMYCIIVSVVDLNLYKSVLFPLVMMSGFLFGAAVVFFCLSKWDDKRVIKWGYFISIISLIPYFIFSWNSNNAGIVLQGCYFFHAAGNAFLSAAFMSFLAKERSHHVQGRTYGLIDSSDTFAFTIGTLIGICIENLLVSTSYLVVISFISFLFSFKYYKRFQKHVLQK